MRRLLNVMKLQSVLASGTSRTRAALVSSYDPDNYCCKVVLQPDGVETGWLPIGAMGVGNGWGLFIPPNIDDEVEVRYHEDDLDCGYVALRFYNNEDRPVKAESGVIYLIHKSGSYLKFENNGSVKMHSTTEIDVGDCGGSLKKLVTDAFVSLFNGHTHQVSGVQGGGGTVTSAAPAQQMGDSQLTSKLKGN